MNLTSDDFRRIYNIGKTFFLFHESTMYEEDAVELMDLAERVIGEQKDRPRYSKRKTNVRRDC